MMSNQLSYSHAYPFIQNNKMVIVMGVIGYPRSLLSRLMLLCGMVLVN